MEYKTPKEVADFCKDEKNSLKENKRLIKKYKLSTFWNLLSIIVMITILVIFLLR